MTKCILAEQKTKGGGDGGTSIVLRSIEVTTPPTKTNYLAGDTFNIAGMVVTASYGLANSAAILTTVEVTGSCTITPSPLTDGTTEVTIRYSENGNEVTTTQSITVTHRLQSLAVTANPTKTIYEYGDTLNTAGLEVTATYSDTTSSVITGTCSPTSLTTVGAQEITVSYAENGVTQTTSFNVTVNRKSIAKPTWKANLNYSGSSQSVNNTISWDNYSTTTMDISGVTSGTNAGTYTATFTPKSNYRWTDGSTDAANVNWVINKVAPTFSLSATSVSIDGTNKTRTVTITTNSDGVLSISPTSVTGLTTLSLSGKTITITGNGSTAISSQTITVSLAAGTNWTAPSSKTFTVSAQYWTWGADGAAVDAAWFTGLKNYLASNKGSTIKTSSNGNILGTTKSVTLTSAVLGTTTHLIKVIGVDQDADNTVTFQTANCLAETTTWSTTAYDSTNTTAARWIDSACKAKAECVNYYNAFPGKSAIKTVKKGTCDSTNDSRNGTPTYRDETVWLPSEREMGLNSVSPLSTENSTTSKAECTQGKNFSYAYYTSNETRKKKLGDSGSDYYYWERSRCCNSSSNSPTLVCLVSSNGTAGRNTYHDSSGLAPAFVIGN